MSGLSLARVVYRGLLRGTRRLDTQLARHGSNDVFTEVRELSFPFPTTTHTHHTHTTTRRNHQTQGTPPPPLLSPPHQHPLPY
jgi:hypothetical protein